MTKKQTQNIYSASNKQKWGLEVKLHLLSEVIFFFLIVYNGLVQYSAVKCR